MKSALPFLLAAMTLSAVVAADAIPMKAHPTRRPEGSSIQVRQLEVLPDCPSGKVCADGVIENIGLKTAYLVRLKVELGGTKHGKPRTYFVQHFEDNVMEPGETQEFSLLIDRKFPYKDAQKKDKIIEVGRFNFKVVPVWANKPAALKPAKK